MTFIIIAIIICNSELLGFFVSLYFHETKIGGDGAFIVKTASRWQHLITNT